MSLESEFGIGPEKEAAIVDHFRRADALVRLDPRALRRRISSYPSLFGHINFAALEHIFRSHDFFTHQLAVPSQLVEAENPGHMVLNPNLAQREYLVPAPYATINCGSLEDAQKKAGAYYIEYDPAINMRCLDLAGQLFKRPTFAVPIRIFP